jgi:hypothetical protein
MVFLKAMQATYSLTNSGRMAHEMAQEAFKKLPRRTIAPSGPCDPPPVAMTPAIAEQMRYGRKQIEALQALAAKERGR